MGESMRDWLKKMKDEFRESLRRVREEIREVVKEEGIYEEEDREDEGVT